MSYFVYRSLTPNQKRIRLVHILPENHHPLSEQASSQPLRSRDVNNIICCTLSHVSLNNAPPYNALSYYWGDQTQRCDILLDGITISITRNLETALRHLRLQDEPLVMWIDALCIDQEDPVEKSEQIDQMRQVYARAHLVTTWLGPAADDSDLAMRWIEHFGKLASELGIGSRPELQLRCLLEAVESDGKISIEGDIRSFVEKLKVQLSQEGAEQLIRINALGLLFKRPYWSRVWVVQELVSASQVVFVCGTEKVSEEALHHSLRLLRNFRRYQILKFGQDRSQPELQRHALLSIDTHDPITLLKFRRAAGPFPMVYLLRSLRKFAATDARDKIFALLGIASDAEALGLRPDYGKSCVEVYSDVALALIRNGYYDLLSLSDSSKRVDGLPSWSPDWSTKNRRKPLQERSIDRSVLPLASILEPIFSASGISQVQYSFGGSGTIRSMPLLLHGAFISKVGELGTVWENGDVGVWLQDLDRLSCLAKNNFGTTEERQRSVWRTAVADQEVRQGQKKPRLSKQKLNSLHEILKDENLSLTKEHTLVDSGLGDYYDQLQVVAAGRRPLSFSARYYGIGPQETQTGDALVIFPGAQVPYILRRCSGDSNFELVGEAYIHGIMDGEAMRDVSTTEIIPLV